MLHLGQSLIPVSYTHLVRTMEQLLERMEAGDSREEAQALRAQLEHLLPTVWEEELSGQIQALFRSKTAQDV